MHWPTSSPGPSGQAVPPDRLPFVKHRHRFRSGEHLIISLRSVRPLDWDWSIPLANEGKCLFGEHNKVGESAMRIADLRNGQAV